MTDLLPADLDDDVTLTDGRQGVVTGVDGDRLSVLLSAGGTVRVHRGEIAAFLRRGTTCPKCAGRVAAWWLAEHNRVCPCCGNRIEPPTTADRQDRPS